MFEARILLESNLAALAAERGTKEHHAALAEEVAEIFATVESPYEFLIHDVLFHRFLSQASGNPILAAIMETVTTSMYDNRRKTVERSVDLRESAEMHYKIYRAVRARKPLEARRPMEGHLRLAQAAQDSERPSERKAALAVARTKKSAAEQNLPIA
jgi:GntR family transcriptional repressor for pyruvate dehydrogenase complex